jgi:hypothetical protein
VEQGVAQHFVDVLVSRLEDVLDVEECLVRILRITHHQVNLLGTK